MPVLAVGAEGALGELVPEQAQKYADDVTSAVVPGGHWIAEEAPEILLGTCCRSLTNNCNAGDLAHRYGWGAILMAVLGE